VAWQQIKKKKVRDYTLIKVGFYQLMNGGSYETKVWIASQHYGDNRLAVIRNFHKHLPQKQPFAAHDHSITMHCYQLSLCYLRN
jgi:hypothetical protein